MLFVLVVLALIAVAFGREVASGIAFFGFLTFAALCILLIGALVVTLWPPFGVGLMVTAGGALVYCGGRQVAGVARQAKQAEERRIAAEDEKEQQTAWLGYLRNDLDKGDELEVFATCTGMTERGWFHVALPLLRASLFETSEETRFRAAEGLACTDEGNADYCAELLSERLEDTSESARVRAKAAKALSRIGSPTGLPALMQHLKDADGEVRAACCRGVGGVLSRLQPQSRMRQDEDGQHVASRLINILAADPYTPARIEAARALGAIGEVRALRALQEGADDPHQPEQLREVASEAVGRIRAGAGQITN